MCGRILKRRPDASGNNGRESLASRGLKPTSVSTQISDVRRLEKHYGDLDELYDPDRLAGVLNNLSYTKDDEQRNRPNPSLLEIDGDLNSNLSHFRSSLGAYRDFREATGETQDELWQRLRASPAGGPVVRRLRRGHLALSRHLRPRVPRC